VQLVGNWRGRPLARVLVPTGGDALGASRIRELLAARLADRLCGREGWQKARAAAALRAALLGQAAPAPRAQGFAAAAPVSLVVATCDRPEQLRSCLRSLVKQDSERPVEIVVVDNHPASGLTPPVLAEFPQVRCIAEPRRGLSYARNAGIAASRGEIVITTDDDVTAPPEWLERLLAPFARPEVAIVTGQILPEELASDAQEWFERYGGLGRGWQPFEVGAAWLAGFAGHAVPTWSLGATANAAFRASLFADPRLAGFDEALGAGSASGCSEDTELFYRALRAGHTLVYEPTAYVWHRHRRSMRELRRQLYAYSKGHVAYHWLIGFRDGDRGALRRLRRELPRWHARELKRWLGARTPFPLRRWLDGFDPFPLPLIAAQIAGNLAGPWALWRSRRRARRLGRRTAE
jgi:GT2 family glycosyltransferase